MALDIGYDRYALYGHLIPSSIKVKQGELVKGGQVLARLGNSGNSTEPHLHFQVADAPSFLNADGLPYLYDRVGLQPSRVVGANVDPPVVRVTGRHQNTSRRCFWRTRWSFSRSIADRRNSSEQGSWGRTKSMTGPSTVHKSS